jgi:putative ABC transport system permease protein
MELVVTIRGTKTGAYTIYGDYPELIKQEQVKSE